MADWHIITKMNKKPAKIVILTLYFAGLGILILLGGWQLVRGLEKQVIDRQLAAGGDSRVRLDRSREDWQTLNRRQVELDGKWLPEKVFLMENRVYNGIVGHEVWAPFMLKGDDTVMLVNLGWSTDVQTLPGTGMSTGADGNITGGHFRPPLHNVGMGTSAAGTVAGGHGDPPLRKAGDGTDGGAIGTGAADRVTVRGQLTLPETGFTLGPAFTDQSAWPRRIQYFDRSGLAQALGFDLAPAVLVIAPGESQALTRIWKPYTMSATRHIGYAAQWWGLAVTLIVFGIIWLKSSRKQQSS